MTIRFYQVFGIPIMVWFSSAFPFLHIRIGQKVEELVAAARGTALWKD